MPVFITNAAQSAARDAAAIAAGTPSFNLMLRAGSAAVDALTRHASAKLARGVAIYAGTGNNGGDAWIVAARLRALGHSVRVHAFGEPATPDAIEARARAIRGGAFSAPDGTEQVAVDGLLGTGARGAPRGAMVSAFSALAVARARGAFVLALDIPSGVDASTGDVPADAVPADCTVTFGTMKRGLVIARDVVGAIEVADIGLGAHAAINDGAPELLDPVATRALVPRIDASAHKGTRGRLTIVGGNVGMAGAPVLTARGALRSGAGLVRLVVAPGSSSAVQAAVPEATGATWPLTPAEAVTALGAADAVVIGPGLGSTQRELVELLLGAGACPVVLDADALNAFAGDAAALRSKVGARSVVLTPHPAECARLLGVRTDDVLRDRFDVGLELARMTGAVVVLKGTPTVVSAPDGRVVVAPVGSPVLATGGSGDVLAGIIGTLLCVMPDAHSAALAGVWAHGTAAEAVATSRVRGTTLADVVDALREVWMHDVAALPDGVIAVCPAVGER